MSGDHEQRTFYCKECFKTLRIPVRVFEKSYEGHDLCQSCRPLVKPPERILTEEELSKLVHSISKGGVAEKVNTIVNSHRALFAANASLQNELAAAKAESEIWRRKLHKEANQ